MQLTTQEAHELGMIEQARAIAYQQAVAPLDARMADLARRIETRLGLAAGALDSTHVLDRPAFEVKEVTVPVDAEQGE